MPKGYNMHKNSKRPPRNSDRSSQTRGYRSDNETESAFKRPDRENNESRNQDRKSSEKSSGERTFNRSSSYSRNAGSRPEGRSEGRSEGRADSRPESRSDSRSEGRFGGRSDSRPDSRPRGRTPMRGGSDNNFRGIDRNAPDGRADGRTAEGRAGSKPYGRPTGDNQNSRPSYRPSTRVPMRGGSDNNFRGLDRNAPEGRTAESRPSFGDSRPSFRPDNRGAGRDFRADRPNRSSERPAGRFSDRSPESSGYAGKPSYSGNSSYKREDGRERSNFNKPSSYRQMPAEYSNHSTSPKEHGDADSSAFRASYSHAPDRSRNSAPNNNAEALDSNQEEQGAEEGTLIFGPKAVLEILESDPGKVDSVMVLKGRRSPENEKILDLCRTGGVRFSLADEKALERLMQKKGSFADDKTDAQRRQHNGIRHQGVIARLFQSGYVDFEELLAKAMDAPLPLIIALDQVQDPGNVGTLARTLFAFGGAGLLMPKHNGAFLGYAATKASAGALAQLPVARVSNLKQALREAEKEGFTIYGASHDEKATNIFNGQLRLPAILVLGSEEKGLRDSVEAQCLEVLSIPMLREMDSLNVAQSGGIIAAQFLATKFVKK